MKAKKQREIIFKWSYEKGRNPVTHVRDFAICDSCKAEFITYKTAMRKEVRLKWTECPFCKSKNIRPWGI